MQAIKKRSKDFAAIIALFIIAAVVGGYILSNQRLNPPGWVPVVGQEFFELKGEFSTAQAVTPGQGQTVNIAGVKVGEISKVDLVEGRAVVSMNIEPKYAAVYRDATMLLRPKTGLKDMIIELTPGTPTAGKLKEGQTVPIQSTLPDINPDEILASLDRDTRDYLKLLLGAGGEGLRGEGKNISAAFRRFEPTARDLAKITGKLSERRRNVARVIHNFQLLSTALGDRAGDISDFVKNSNAVFTSFANQEARLRESLRLLPPTLTETQIALAKIDRLADEMGPTLSALRPAARALGPALREVRPFLRDSTPIIRDTLRPFTRDALPTVRILKPTLTDLSNLTPNLTTTFKVVNRLVDMLAYNPPGQEEGFLFWVGWANHAGATVFNLQDAHGPIRRGLILVSCSSLDVLDNVAAANPALSTLISLLNAPRQSQVCPGATPVANKAQGPGTPQGEEPAAPAPAAPGRSANPPPQAPAPIIDTPPPAGGAEADTAGSTADQGQVGG